jgi:hypothetical protein
MIRFLYSPFLIISLNGTEILILAISLSKLKGDGAFSTSLMTASFLASGIFFGGYSLDFPFSIASFVELSFLG